MNLVPYGERLGPGDVAEYPESGIGGRYGHRDQVVFLSLLPALADAFGLTLQSQQRAWIPSLRSEVYGGRRFGTPDQVSFVFVVALFGAVIGVGWFRAACYDPAARRLLCLLFAGCIGTVSATVFAPYVFQSERYLIYSVPVFTVIALPAATKALFALHERALVRCTAVLLMTAACLLLLGGRGGGDAGLNINLTRNRAIYEYISLLPEDVVLAGWPTGVIENLPYLCRRKVLITREIHNTLHKGYVNEMRRLISALIDAYFAADSSPLLRLRDEFGVTHLLVDLSNFGSRPPSYFAPFDQWTYSAHRRAVAEGCFTVDLATKAPLFRKGSLVLISLSGL